MSTYISEPMPREMPALSEALEREHLRIEDALRHLLDLEPRRQSEVPRPADGMLRYFDENVFNPGLGTGFYGFELGQWQRFATTANTATRLVFKAFMGYWTPNGGSDAEREYNIHSIASQGSGVYRFTVAQNTMLGENLLLATIPVFTVYPFNKLDEGFIIPTPRAGGTDGEGRTYFDVHLTETYVQGQSLRARSYTLTGDEAVAAVGACNVMLASAEPLPP